MSQCQHRNTENTIDGGKLTVWCHDCWNVIEEEEIDVILTEVYDKPLPCLCCGTPTPNPNYCSEGCKAFMEGVRWSTT